MKPARIKMKSEAKSTLPIPIKKDYNFGDWTIKTVKSHIMGSKCEDGENCLQNSICNHCRFKNELDLPSLPDMVFANNSLAIIHKHGGLIKFNALDALKKVEHCPKGIEVAHAKVWQEARSECEFSKRMVKDYDWTFSTSYSGTIEGLESVPTNERINLEKLKEQEEIKFYQEIFLYEDELDDNGCTRCIVKVRIMPSGFFVVLRHYLRVDHVIIKVHDTRLYHASDSTGILRERSIRELPMSQLKVDAATYKNPDLVWQYLSLKEEIVDKICPRIQE